MKKSCAVGCLVIIVLLAAGIFAVKTMAPAWLAKGKTFVTEMLANEARIAAFEKTWTPPSPTPGKPWAPVAVGDWKLDDSGAAAGWPELSIDRAGYQLQYSTAGRNVKIGVVAANDLEKETLIQRITESAKAGAPITTQVGGMQVTTQSSGSSTTTTTLGSRTDIKSSSIGKTRIWWLKGWLFFFRTPGDIDLAKLSEEYLAAISATPPAEPKVEAEHKK